LVVVLAARGRSTGWIEAPAIVERAQGLGGLGTRRLLIESPVQVLDLVTVDVRELRVQSPRRQARLRSSSPSAIFPGLAGKPWPV
jgi:hypothetical protein